MSSGAYLYARCVMGDGMARVGRVCGRLEVLRAPPGAVVLVAAAAVLAGAPREAAGQCYYTYEQIPNPLGRQCYARSINNQGWVTGYAGNAGDTYRAFIWTPETGTTVLPLPEGYNSQKAFDINELGHVVGFVSGIGGSRAFLWDGQQTTILERPAWASHMEAYGINSSGQIVGMVTNNNIGPKHAFLWTNGLFTDLTPYEQIAVAEKINEGGQIVGYIGPSASRHGFIIDSHGMELLGEPEGLTGSTARGLNNNGWVVGNGSTPRGRPGVVWRAEMTDVIPPPSGTGDLLLYEINENGRAVGYYYTPTSTIVAWQSGVVTDLRPLVVGPPIQVLDIAWCINNRGQIAAWASGSHNGSIVLTPVWVIGDLTGDCHVSLEDLLLVLIDFGSPSGSFPQGDVDFDGDVDLGDLGQLLANWGT
ncbi:MAG: hypothetical protein IT450_05630 [Phycisphaerales bacterium]|nr:hypothetical protein [Phycisphaerales bacterium]